MRAALLVRTSCLPPPPRVGADADPAPVHQICAELFRRAEALRAAGEGKYSYTVETSYIEIYNEKVKDLLNPKNKRCVGRPARFGASSERLIAAARRACAAVTSRSENTRRSGRTSRTCPSSSSAPLRTSVRTDFACWASRP